jgi:hypothetical protein
MKGAFVSAGIHFGNGEWACRGDHASEGWKTAAYLFASAFW